MSQTNLKIGLQLSAPLLSTEDSTFGFHCYLLKTTNNLYFPLLSTEDSTLGLYCYLLKTAHWVYIAIY